MTAGHRAEITLRGSVEVITEFFHYALNNILYQRCVYPASLFRQEKKYGLSLMVTQDEKLQEYLTSVLSQMDKWLTAGHVQRLVLVFVSAATKEVRERWTFNVQQERDAVTGAPVMSSAGSGKTLKDVTREIQGIMRQITASVSFLPVVDEILAFDLLVYCAKETHVPRAWEDSAPLCIPMRNQQDVRLASFSTTVHRVDTMVTYRCDDDVEGDASMLGIAEENKSVNNGKSSETYAAEAGSMLSDKMDVVLN
ncbi:unnamed protein product [Amoebophrya sp. A25]|nr:unnamed protein product [Amoebophrya sp. A25]|eukprot:GSA25T00019149001.1